MVGTFTHTLHVAQMVGFVFFTFAAIPALALWLVMGR